MYLRAFLFAKIPQRPPSEEGGYENAYCLPVSWGEQCKKDPVFQSCSFSHIYRVATGPGKSQGKIILSKVRKCLNMSGKICFGKMSGKSWGIWERFQPIVF